MTATKCIEYCRGADQNFTIAVLETEKCSCGSDHTLNMDASYILSKTKCRKDVTGTTGSWNERTMIGDDNGSPNPTVALYNIQHEINRYHADKYGATTCFEVTRDLMITR